MCLPKRYSSCSERQPASRAPFLAAWGSSLTYYGPTASRRRFGGVSVENSVHSATAAVAARRRTNMLAACALFAAVIAIQLATGAFQSELGNDSDEAAHFMNALLVRDYLWTGIGENPIRFAERYYLSYPKIAPLMWPPLFHVTLGTAMLPGWPPHGAAIVLIAIFIAWTAWRLYTMAKIVSSPGAALTVAALFLLAPDVVRSAHSVMVDIAVAAFALESAYWLALYLDDDKEWRYAIAFGVAAAGACLSKPNGVAVILMPPVLALLARRPRLLWRPGMFAAAAIVLVLAAPFVLISYRLDSAIGDFALIRPGDVGARLVLYTRYLVEQLGIVLLAFALIGVTDAVWPRNAQIGRRTQSMRQAIAALALAACVFHLLNPHQTAAGRYLLLAVAPILGLAPSATDRIIDWARSRSWGMASQVGIVAAFALAFVFPKHGLAAVRPLGFGNALRTIDERGGVAGRRMLVVTDEYGEGAFVSAVAMRNAKPSPIVIRGTKLLAAGDWMDHDFRLTFDSAAAIERELEDLHVDYVVVDRTEESRRRFWPQVDEMIRQFPDRFASVTAASSGSGSRRMDIYRLTHWSAGEAKKVQVSLQYSLGRTIE